ncbi:hypothetical protein BCR39DRAFT_550827 [Naematelia encephala]|uniref:N-acetyltransferase domain-containing protein n=1 Tax=Naematelia encephala TaxID=71784 RepID=A0A1Y2AKM3_9TREE|nr:hypothetical protein BCR39DRAFT_550827 [Naematelia encephala]
MAHIKYCNYYAGPATPPSHEDQRDAHRHTPYEMYDFNWSFGKVQLLRCDTVELRPLVPSLYAQGFVEGSQDAVLQDMYHVRDLGDVLDYLEWSRQDTGVMMFAIFTDPSTISKPVPTWATLRDPPDPTAGVHTEGWVFAGVVGLYRAQLQDLVADIGIFLWAFARGTGLSDRASALVIRWAMGSAESGLGLGLRRLDYAADGENRWSQKLAMRLGVKSESSRRENHTMKVGDTGPSSGLEEEVSQPNHSKKDWRGSITREDWDDGEREHINSILGG